MRKAGATWGVGALMIALVHAYRTLLSPVLGPRCRHLPTCSEYCLDAIRAHGAGRGSWLTLKRLLRCHPWGTSGYDPVPLPTGSPGEGVAPTVNYSPR